MRLFLDTAKIDEIRQANQWGVISGVTTNPTLMMQGAKGSGIMGEGQDDPRLFKGWNQTSENLVWRYKGPKCDKYQYEHDLFFDAIRNDKPYNEVQYGVEASLVTSLGRMAAHTGQEITYEQMLNCEHEFAPDVGKFTDQSSPAPADYRRELDLATGVHRTTFLIDPDGKMALLRGGECLPYDRLLIATGASAVSPSIPGVVENGLFIGLATCVIVGTDEGAVVLMKD